MNLAISAHQEKEQLDLDATSGQLARETRRAASRAHPRSAKDFRVMMDDIKEWHAGELARIGELELTDEERTQLRIQILEQETKLIQNVDRLRAEASKKAHDERAVNTLKAMTTEKKWNTGDGPVQVKTD